MIFKFIIQKFWLQRKTKELEKENSTGCSENLETWEEIPVRRDNLQGGFWFE